MVFTALLVGLLTAYYFGVRPGVWAAAGTAILCVAAIVKPGWALWLYAALGSGVVGVVMLGPRFQKPGARQKIDLAVRWSIARARKGLRDWRGDKK